MPRSWLLGCFSDRGGQAGNFLLAQQQVAGYLCAHQQPLQSLCLLHRSFGTPAVPLKQLVKDLQPLFESKDVKARDKVKEIVVSDRRPPTKPCSCPTTQAWCSAGVQRLCWRFVCKTGHPCSCIPSFTRLHVQAPSESHPDTVTGSSTVTPVQTAVGLRAVAVCTPARLRWLAGWALTPSKQPC
jgi:hypothetical protein